MFHHPPPRPIPKLKFRAIISLPNNQEQPQSLNNIAQFPPREKSLRTLDTPHDEIKAVAQRICQSLSMVNVENGKGILTFNLDGFGNVMLYYGDKTTHAHEVKAVAGVTEA
ncbi:hypothetical protein HO173_013433 [Letharia columbiana]|uniref:Uncharacterized protein n=1 Tax=Letharia columbiana TaxID=112416 RepID=A0A8H6CFC8_9LECA|nr:uncharacterized protein HO173_013433 [Letharia columbiana]KAF6222467.1 hypothetical protein HO173_013433 [Letharia columbiana]